MMGITRTEINQKMGKNEEGFVRLLSEYTQMEANITVRSKTVGIIISRTL